MTRIPLTFLLTSALGAAMLASLHQNPPQPAAPSGQQIRVLLSYQPGAASSQAQYLFPSLSLVPIGGSVQVSSGPNRENLRPIVTVFANKPLSFKPQNGRLVATFEGLIFTLDDVVQLKPADSTAAVRYWLLSITRQNRIPEYPGELWLENRGAGLLVINKVDYQEYLRQVLPSEMPANFPSEALQAQAVAARTYALTRQLTDTYWKQFGADTDDSSSEQVYDPTRRHPATDAAVEATRDQILTFAGQPIQSFFFSTSPGATASIEEVWMDRPALPYLKGRSQAHPIRVWIGSEAEALDFFRNWNPEGFYDAQSPFWRWKLSLSREELEAILARTLPEKAQQSPQFVQTLEGPLSPQAPGFTLGTLQKISVLKRTTSGYVTELEIQTSTGRYVVRRESHIRSLLRPDKALTKGADVLLELWQGGSRLNFPSLPSAAFAIQEERDAGGALLRLVFWGGGFGHGVGMSQYAALGLARRGYGYRAILEHFYPGTALTVWSPVGSR